ncbi:MAG: uracil-DNA glycosylase [Desulfobacteraceae bacterium]|nr:uracil-DNA glycosylase [Desulfobacteraceae bacterium]
MRPEDDIRELAACLDRLRWTVSGLRAGGIQEWRHVPRNLTPAKSEASRPPAGEAALEALGLELKGCTRCRLHSGRKSLVFGEGSVRSGLVFVGEGPGFEEDQQGRPFVGRAGRLLDKMIEAMGFHRPEVYICNVVKCRPPENRTPQSDEIEACSPFLFRQIEALAPKVICALGACAAQTLLGRASPISRLRGRIHFWRGVPLICTFHPAYLLRNAAQKGAAWQDLKEVIGTLRS